MFNPHPTTTAIFQLSTPKCVWRNLQRLTFPWMGVCAHGDMGRDWVNRTVCYSPKETTNISNTLWPLLSGMELRKGEAVASMGSLQQPKEEPPSPYTKTQEDGCHSGIFFILNWPKKPVPPCTSESPEETHTGDCKPRWERRGAERERWTKGFRRPEEGEGAFP